MNGFSLLCRLRDRGLEVECQDGRLFVGPSGMLTDEIRSAIREHKSELLRELRFPPPTGRCSRCGGCAYYRSAAGAWACLSCSDVPKAVPLAWLLTPDVPAARDA